MRTASWRSRSRLIAGAAFAALLLVGLAAPPQASAATANGNAYLVVNNWRCVGGGKVTGIWLDNSAVSYTRALGDWGDNIVYLPVRLNTTNTLNGRAYCDRPWYKGPDYYINITWWQIRPTANKQTFWY